MEGRALEGLRVVELNTTGAASYAAKLMADLGADVIKLEPPGGDPDRRLGPFPGGEPHPEKSGTFLYLNCNKRGVTLDLSRDEGRQVLRRLVSTVDVLVHDLPPVEASALGLTYDELEKVNGRLVMASISPFGESGPYRDYKAYDLTISCAGGWTFINGQPGGDHSLPPLRAFGRQTAYQAALNAAVATMGALFARLRSGQGQHIEVSAQECITAMLELSFEFWPYMHVPVMRWGQRPVQPIDFFQCKDGGWIFVLCLEERQWQDFVDMMGNPEWASWEVFGNIFARASNWDVLRPLIEEWVAQWTVQDLYHAAQARRIPFAPASTMADLLNSEHLKARGFFVEVAHPVAGTLQYPGAPYKLSATPWEIRSPAPVLGQHTNDVLSGLGLSDQEIDGLRERGVIA
jgi:crotonobetainyl-CoA:carnitine CoA-transferase CaiB-like acyl-CoA transferase